MYSVAKILYPLVGLTRQHLKNSRDLVDKLKDVKMKTEECMVSYDVSALFTSVPVKEALEITQRLLRNDTKLKERTLLSADQVTELLAECLNTTYFVYQGKFYVQTHGAAMGSPVSPIIANIFMEDFETKTLSTFDHPPSVWARYVDDTFVILQQDQVDKFTEHLNESHPDIKFTIEREENGSLAMLDTLVTRKTDGSLSFSVFRKTTHTDQYLDFNSHQPLQHKLGVIRTLTHRAKTICSDDTTLEAEMSHVAKSLSICNYPKWSWTMVKNKKMSPSGRSNTERTKGYVSVPYVQGLTEALTRKMRRAGITVHTRPFNTIRSKLVRPKDKPSKLDKHGAIYHISCDNCPAQYIGETERVLAKRLKEHHKPPSPVGEHMTNKHHKFNECDVKVLDSDARWLQRGIKEAIYIAARHPQLNRDSGRYTLSGAYNDIIESWNCEQQHSQSHSMTQ